jgi:two-component system heavy metal sensor histidine kinase CusS
MSSNNANPQGHRRSWGLWKRPPSMMVRLTVLYTLSVSLLLIATTGFLYWILVVDLLKTSHQFLHDKTQVLLALLREPLESSEGLEVEVNSDQNYLIRVFAPTGRILIESPNMNSVLPPNIFPSPTMSTMPLEDADRIIETRNGKWYLAGSVIDVIGHPRYGPPRLQVALDITRQELLLATYRKRLLLVLSGGILISAAAGAAVARRGIRPLRDITGTVERITATQLHERISPTHWPKELSSLAIAFDDMLDRLEKSFLRLSQFSADLAHELRTPVQNLMGETEVALSRKRTPEEYREVLESSLEEFSKLARMIDGLLFLARAERAERSIKARPIDAKKEIEAVLAFHEALAQEQGVRLHCHGNAILYADSILFRRAVTNLVSNALNYTPRDGSVDVFLKPLPDDGAEVRIEDTGSGIGPEHLPRILDRFYRADSARSEHRQGLGLGLSIVKSIMDLHGGTVDVQSTPSKGTVVTLRFPPAALIPRAD